MTVTKSDFVVIGGGIVGIGIARELKRRYGDCSVTLLEKEAACGRHASGRNSGVLHAGFYYTPDSLKARFTRDGNRELTEYCERWNIPLNRCGKLVVAQSESDLPVLDMLHRRGNENGVRLEMMSAADARRIEPRVRTVERALYSPTTSSVDPSAVLAALERDARAEGVHIQCGARYVTRHRDVLTTTAGKIAARYVVNAAGLYADRVARDFGFSRRHRIVPFKGLYLYSDEPVGSLRTHVYPVPDMRYPFLGVHHTVTVDGHSKIGPTAIPAFWREQYRGFENFRVTEMGEILWRHLGLMAFSRTSFARLAAHELAKYSRRRMVALAGRLLDGVDPLRYRRWGRPGIRAQLVNLHTRTLEMDFVLEGDGRSMHVLNAVSPAFTCGLSFARFVVDAVTRQASLNAAAVASDSTLPVLAPIAAP